MKILWLAPLLFGLLTLAACEKKPHEPPTPHTDKPPQSALLSGPIRALDKAKGVEQVVRQQDRETREAIDQASR